MVRGKEFANSALSVNLTLNLGVPIKQPENNDNIAVDKP